MNDEKIIPTYRTVRALRKNVLYVTINTSTGIKKGDIVFIQLAKRGDFDGEENRN